MSHSSLHLFEIPFTVVEKFRGHKCTSNHANNRGGTKRCKSPSDISTQVTDHNVALLSTDNIPSHILKTCKKFKNMNILKGKATRAWN
jgi:hypothetical protein